MRKNYILDEPSMPAVANYRLDEDSDQGLYNWAWVSKSKLFSVKLLIFLTHQFEHVFRVLKNASLRRFF